MTLSSARFVASLIVAFVVISVFADRGSPQRVMAGTVLEFEPGKWISFTNDMVDPGGLRFTLRDTTVFEGPAIQPGDVVTVWYRSVGERGMVADKVRVGRSPQRRR